MSSTAVKNTLGKKEKLKSRKQIDSLFANAQAFTAFPVKVIFTITDSAADAAGVQIGVTASARNFKHAADRNRIKRLLREAYRLQKHELIATATAKSKQVSVFFLYLDKQMPTYDLLYDKMRYCLKRLRKKMEEEQGMDAPTNETK
jgi:ribonuclease P protein component